METIRGKVAAHQESGFTKFSTPLIWEMIHFKTSSSSLPDRLHFYLLLTVRGTLHHLLHYCIILFGNMDQSFTRVLFQHL